MWDVEIKLHIDPNVPPVVQPERRIPFHLRNKVADELKRLEENDIIEDATGPTPWVSPMVAAPKPKNHNEVRLCVDMRLPNQAIRRERHPSPTVDDIIHSLTVLLRNNLTLRSRSICVPNASRTRPERVQNAFRTRSKCVPNAFRTRSICVPNAFHLRTERVPNCVP